MSQKKVYLKVWGCQMNDRDSQHVLAQFLNDGYHLADNPQDADVVLFNTCSVRQHAEDKVWSELGRLKQIKKKNPDLIIGILGCMAQNLQSAIIEKMPYVDLICGPNDLARVSEYVKNIQQKRRNILAINFEQRDPEFYKNLYQPDKKHSYVVIMEGCNNFCSYCIVPYVRGRERSRPFPDIIKEIEQLIKKRIFSVTLLGQNVNSYNGGCSFSELLIKVNQIKGIKELSFVTSHPKDASVALFEAMRDSKNVKKYLHLPIQSGSDRILKLMNRGYTREHYLDLVRQYRDIVGEKAVLGTDIIVGFPSETEQDFEDSRAVIEQVKFDFAYIFKYSIRTKTKAAELADDVVEEEKKRRHRILLDLQKEISTGGRCVHC